jgi:deoxyribonuclease V
LQRELAARVQVCPLPPGARWVAGLDAAFSRDGAYCLAGVVVFDLLEHRVIEQQWAQRRAGFPYVPGFLSFREAPALLAALRRVVHPVDVLMCDGQGLAHPRRLGIACHVGLFCEMPSLGCAKSRLVGEHGAVALRRGSSAPLFDRGECVGDVVRTRDGVRPVYVSPGHRLDRAAARSLVLAGYGGYRLPEPTRQADRYVARLKRSGV